MHQILLALHSFLRWLVLLSLLYAIYRSARAYLAGRSFTKIDNAIRHWTATISHIQLTIGMVLYFNSPIVNYATTSRESGGLISEAYFFKIAHITFMISAVVLITVGSSLAKRNELSRDKFKTMFLWFTVALIFIFLAIPWPFSPLISRPYIRTF